MSPRRAAPASSVQAPDAAEMRQLAEVFRQEAGLVFADDSGFVLERRLRERVAALGLPSFAHYVDYLRYDPGGARELEEALELVTTHETYFFREEYQLRAFRDEVVPRLRQLAGARRRLSVWSAGCATGEEAYTVAMLLAHGALPPGWQARVLGSDLSRRCVAAARRAVYGPAAFRCVPFEFRQQYFAETAEGTAVSPPIRAMCSFVQLNLLDRDRLAVVGRVDAIFCRNVLIYLDQEARRRVLDNVYECLLPGGFLMLGHSESLLHVPSGFEPVRLRDDLVYRKPEGAQARRGGAP
ncbi:MAG TPA: protein-glutamate O-methyltransferase CheR [Polyangiaceae bacterium]|nr:protein-glutamate O-methyltransferase CheR [Polyangiaceae bacterium]